MDVTSNPAGHIKSVFWSLDASPQPSLGESFNGMTAGLPPANKGSIPSSSTKFAGGRRDERQGVLWSRLERSPLKHNRQVSKDEYLKATREALHQGVARLHRIGENNNLEIDGRKAGVGSLMESGAEIRACHHFSDSAWAALRTGRSVSARFHNARNCW